MQILKKQEWTEFLWRNNVYNAKFNVEQSLEHGCAMRHTYFKFSNFFTYLLDSFLQQ